MWRDRGDLLLIIILSIGVQMVTFSEKQNRKEIWASPMTKAPTTTTTEKCKKQVDNTKTPPKTSITQKQDTSSDIEQQPLFGDRIYAIHCLKLGRGGDYKTNGNII